eukprot:TRINITY_DN5427_c0_g1_i1.p1 TRINITY_DN5427_c0_g1~~TRINITY_DN5427_c0_g1_i1.p1  ORF type:complete len:1147 (-),score=286.91 TRINITY_DN5427_c0_g1_i1:12-2945(-)
MEDKKAAEEKEGEGTNLLAEAEPKPFVFGFGPLPGATPSFLQQQQEKEEEEATEAAEASPDSEVAVPDSAWGQDKAESTSEGEVVALPAAAGEAPGPAGSMARRRERLRKSVVFQTVFEAPTYKKTRVPVTRTPEIEAVRSKLPVFLEEQTIMEAITDNEVCIICGETGSGKTTQVPQFLYEAGYGCLDCGETPGMIGITQPRRVAALSMAHRVATELNVEIGTQVAYQIRYDTTVDPERTRMKFMTDGILLREIQSDFLLPRYSVVVLDEAHERNINTDILIGLLSRIVPLRNKMHREGKAAKEGDKEPVRPLKLVIMSATLRVEDFTSNRRLFPTPPPVVHVNARQFPVDIHFNKRTSPDYVGETFSKVVKIHTRLPMGGILVFLTGQQEIEYLCRRLRERFPKQDDSEGAPQEPLFVLPLYGALSPEQQQRVFHKVPEGSRLCVVATNVAETALTIPNIVYVVDSGKSKQRRYDTTTGISSFVVDWTSKASADQRAGRAGRTCAGHCYRVYSSAVYNDLFLQHTAPEISRTPVEDVVLQMKAMDIGHILSFPFPTPPERASIDAAQKLLTYLGALTPSGKITPLGKQLALLPVNPRLAKMLCLANDTDVMPWMVTIVASLSVHDLFAPLFSGVNAGTVDEQKTPKPEGEGYTSSLDISKAKKRAMWAHHDSDMLAVLKAVEACRDALQKGETLIGFCRKYSLHQQSMQEILQLRQQLLGMVTARVPEQITALPSKRQELLIRQLIASGLVDHVGKLMTRDEAPEGCPAFAYSVFNAKEPVFIHPTSFLHTETPEFVVCHEIIAGGKRHYMRGVTRVHPCWLHTLAPALAHRSEPLELPPPQYNPQTDRVECSVRTTYGPQGWQLPVELVPHPETRAKYRHFAQALLHGSVVPFFKQLVSHYVTSTNIVTKWSQPKITAILNQLIMHHVDSKTALLQRIQEDKRFLVREIKDLVDPEYQRLVSDSLWSKPVMEAR